MVCYIIPTVGAIACFAGRRHYASRDERLFWLNLMLAGGALFGLIDHLWNGQLFLVGPKIASDLMLGVTITLAIIASWAVVVKAQEFTQKTAVPQPVERQ